MLRTSRLGGLTCWLQVLLVSLLAAGVASAQDKPPVGTSGRMTPEEKAMMDAMARASAPGPNHELLAQVGGDWTFSSRMWMDPSAAPVESTGTVRYDTLLGGRYVRGDYSGTMMGMPFEGIGYMGYDNVSERFQASWMDNFGTAITFMTGRYDPSAKTLTYTGTMDDPMKPGTQVQVRQVIHLTSPDSHSMEWYENRGGKEVKTMEIVYTRKK